MPSTTMLRTTSPRGKASACIVARGLVRVGELFGQTGDRVEEMPRRVTLVTARTWA